jgi:replicative DNA helicase Mcm
MPERIDGGNPMTLEPQLLEKTPSAIKDELVHFLKFYKEENSTQYKYLGAIEQIPISGKLSIEVDYIDLVKANNDFAVGLVNSPSTHFTLLDEALCEAVAQIDSVLYNGKFLDRHRSEVHVRIRGLLETCPLRKVPDNVNKLMMTQGLITRSTMPIPEVRDGVWMCSEGHKTFVHGPKRPLCCETQGCDAKEFHILKEESTFSHYQILRIQETTQELPGGRIPQSFELRVDGELINIAKPGDEVRLVGVVEIEFSNANGKQDTRSLSHQIRANYLETISKSPEDIEISREEIAQMEDFAREPGAYDKLIRSIAPAIEGEELAKESCLLLAVGAYPIIHKDGTRVRGNINILLIGDPGLAKSQLLISISKIAPRGMYSNGRTTSAAGLTAAVVKEKNNLLVLEPGIVVLADQGVACIDELLQMSREDSVALHEAMEQNTVSLNKAGFIATLAARTSILAAANPLFGKYDIYKNILDNLEGLAIPLLTRFDLIVIMRDEADEARDERLAKKIISQIRKKDYDVPPPVDFDFLKKYIAYAKSLQPEITEEVGKIIQKKYIEVRCLYSGPDKVPITPRWLESLIRISIARARCLLHQRVTDDDVRRALDLIDRTIKTAAMDPKTKQIDLGILEGKPLAYRENMEVALATFHKLSLDNQGRKKSVNDQEFIKALVATGKFNQEEAEKMHRVLYRSGQIYEVEPHFFRRV